MHGWVITNLRDVDEQFLRVLALVEFSINTSHFRLGEFPLGVDLDDATCAIKLWNYSTRYNMHSQHNSSGESLI